MDDSIEHEKGVGRQIVTANTLLDAQDIAVHFAGVIAVDGVDLTVRKGEILGLIGPNGAGKTTLINVLSGFQKADRGLVVLNGTDVTSWPPDRRARSGLARTFQATHPFKLMTVYENIEVGAMASGLKTTGAAKVVDRVLKLLNLEHGADRSAGDLALGEERLLGIARALATSPDVLLLDEPGAGLNELESDNLLQSLLSLRQELGCSMVVIEHDMRLVMRLCDRIHVLDRGRTIAIGSPQEIQRDPAVIDAYLGGGHGERLEQ